MKEENPGTLKEKLLIIQRDLKAPKNQYNEFGKYNYRNAEDIQEAVKPLLVKLNCTLLLSDEVVQIGTRFYVKATAILSDDTSNYELRVSGFAREEEDKKGMDGSQITGAASSYARKYALNGMFLIDDTKDSDATNTNTKKEGPKVKVESQKDEMTQDVLLENIKRSKTVEQLRNLHNTYTQFKGNKEIIAALKARKQEILDEEQERTVEGILLTPEQYNVYASLHEAISKLGENDKDEAQELLGQLEIELQQKALPEKIIDKLKSILLIITTF